MADPLDTSPITAADPRVQQILAMIRAKAAPVDTVTPQPQGVVPQQPLPSAPDPGAPATGLPALAPMQEQQPQLPPPQQPNVTQAPQAGPVKSFLQQLVSGLGGAAYQGTQGALQRLGIPTDYEKQQNALKIGLQQQQQNSLEGLRSAQADLASGKGAQLDQLTAPYTIDKGDQSVLPQFRGATTTFGAYQGLQKLSGTAQSQQDIAAGRNATAQSVAQLHYGPNSYADVSVVKHDGNVYLTHKRTGEEQLVGKDTSLISGPNNARARAYYQALYGIVPTVDETGAPTTISRLQALNTGAPNVTFEQAKGVNSDIQGIKLYDQTLDRLSGNLNILNDPAQRVAIAHTLAESKDASPGAVQALITSALQQGALTPQGAQLAADILQARELGGIARKYSGNMNGTEGLMDRIISNQASPINAQELNTRLVQNDKRFTAQALTTAVKTLANTKSTKVPGSLGAPYTAPSTPTDNGGHPSFFHPIKP